MIENWWNYVTRISNGAAQVQIAHSAGVDPGTVSRWKTGRGRPSPESVIEVCRFYERSPVEGLLTAGYLLASECDHVVTVSTSVRDIGSAELINEVSRRLAVAKRLIQEAGGDVLAEGDILGDTR